MPPKKFADILLSVISEKHKNFSDKVTKKISYEVLKEHFQYNEDNFNSFFAKKIKKDEEKKELFIRTMKFYFFWCKEPSQYNVLRSDFKLIVIFSIIEFLMSEEKYITLGDWLMSKIVKEKIKIEDKKELRALLDEYYRKYGSKKSIKSFLENYYDFEEFKRSIKIYNEKSNKFENIENVTEFVTFIDGVRNKFVHQMIGSNIKSEEDYKKESEGYTSFSSSSLILVKGSSYSIDNGKMHIENLLKGFEKALIKYFNKV